MTYSGFSTVTLHSFTPGNDLHVVGLVDRGRSDDKLLADVVTEWFGELQPCPVVGLAISVEALEASAEVDVLRAPIDVSFQSLRSDGSVVHSADSSPMELGPVKNGVADGIVGVWPLSQDVATIRVRVFRSGDSSPTVTIGLSAQNLASAM